MLLVWVIVLLKLLMWMICISGLNNFLLGMFVVFVILIMLVVMNLLLWFICLSWWSDFLFFFDSIIWKFVVFSVVCFEISGFMKVLFLDVLLIFRVFVWLIIVLIIWLFYLFFGKIIWWVYEYCWLVVRNDDCVVIFVVELMLVGF